MPSCSWRQRRRPSDIRTCRDPVRAADPRLLRSVVDNALRSALACGFHRRRGPCNELGSGDYSSVACSATYVPLPWWPSTRPRSRSSRRAAWAVEKLTLYVSRVEGGRQLLLRYVHAATGMSDDEISIVQERDGSVHGRRADVVLVGKLGGAGQLGARR